MSDTNLVVTNSDQTTTEPATKQTPKPERKKPGRKPGYKAVAPTPVETPIAKAVETPPVIKSKKQLHEERMHKLWTEDSKIVRGIFRNHEIPGTSVTFPFRKYKQDHVKEYTLQDGQVYELPRMVATHLNNNCQYTIHKHATDENGKPIAIVGTKIQRFSFYPTDFSDVGADTPKIDIITPI
jgi:hypothetical protein